MRMLNETRRTRLQTAGDWQVEAFEHVRGFEAGGERRRGFGFEWHQPEAVVVHGARGSRRVDMPGEGSGILAAVLPIALYLVTRTIVQRRRQR